ncbi:hypothetical protein AJ79_09914 [Helicocarpus griseus UAMH5409]|uniref:Uncharacterized protein n=1 Tax=Helicocarpus griseus UAMH5409 TaxID=1447875 RepID=A0A2B7WGB6_9EURO|nr:hypothetical protein AJ79_09914 [Helicocarpus griseus UAMH5409]
MAAGIWIGGVIYTPGLRAREELEIASADIYIPLSTNRTSKDRRNQSSCQSHYGLSHSLSNGQQNQSIILYISVSLHYDIEGGLQNTISADHRDITGSYAGVNIPLHVESAHGDSRQRDMSADTSRGEASICPKQLRGNGYGTLSPRSSDEVYRAEDMEERLEITNQYVFEEGILNLW